MVSLPPPDLNHIFPRANSYRIYTRTPDWSLIRADATGKFHDASLLALQLLHAADGTKSVFDLSAELHATTTDVLDVIAHLRDRKLIEVGDAHFSATSLPPTTVQYLSTPLHVGWEITHACNLHCVYCYNSSSHPSDDELTTAEGLALLDQIATNGTVGCCMGGGEPFTRDDIWQFIPKALAVGLSTSVVTNGTLLARPQLRTLRDILDAHPDAKFTLLVSVDAPTARTHDALRGNGTFDAAVRTIKNAVALGIKVHVMTTVTSQNFPFIRQMPSFVASLGATLEALNPVLPQGRAAHEPVDLTPSQHAELLRYTTELSTTPTSNCIHADDILSFLVDDERRAILRKKGDRFCPAGTLRYGVAANGDVKPCPYHPFSVGNIRDTPLKEIWSGSPELQRFRERLNSIPECATCEDRSICQGGCSAFALATEGTYFAPDTRCTLVRSILEAPSTNNPAAPELPVLSNAACDGCTTLRDYAQIQECRTSCSMADDPVLPDEDGPDIDTDIPADYPDEAPPEQPDTKGDDD